MHLQIMIVFFFLKNLQRMIVFLRFYGTSALLHIIIIMTHESLFFDVEGANRVLVSCSSIRSGS